MRVLNPICLIKDVTVQNIIGHRWTRARNLMQLWFGISSLQATYYYVFIHNFRILRSAAALFIFDLEQKQSKQQLRY